MGIRKSRALALALGLVASAGPAAAHTSYMLPSTFDATNAGFVTIQSSFSENFFAPEIAVDSDHWTVIAPDGSTRDFDSVTKLRQLIVMEAELEADGTYRFTSGERLGRTSTEALLPDGSWEVLESADAPMPEGAEGPYSIQTATVADVYVSKGPLTEIALEPDVGVLAISPVTHPNDIFLGEGFTFELLFEGAPLGGHTLTLYRDGGAYEEPGFAQDVVTDETGRAAIAFDRPGVYLLMTRYRAPAPDGAETDIRSYTTSLTFEVLP